MESGVDICHGLALLALRIDEPARKVGREKAGGIDEDKEGFRCENSDITIPEALARIAIFSDAAQNKSGKYRA